MLALYLLTRLPYTLWELLLKANLEHIWHIAGPLSLRISIICLRHEQCVIKNPRTALITSPFLFFLFFFILLSSLEQLLSAKAFVCFVLFFFFLLLFFPTLILEQYCQFLSPLLSKSGTWHVPQVVSVMKRKACLTWHLFSCMGGTKLVVCFDG